MIASKIQAENCYNHRECATHLMSHSCTRALISVGSEGFQTLSYSIGRQLNSYCGSSYFCCRKPHRSGRMFPEGTNSSALPVCASACKWHKFGVDSPWLMLAKWQVEIQIKPSLSREAKDKVTLRPNTVQLRLYVSQKLTDTHRFSGNPRGFKWNLTS